MTGLLCRIVHRFPVELPAESRGAGSEHKALYPEAPSPKPEEESCVIGALIGLSRGSREV